ALEGPVQRAEHATRARVAKAEDALVPFQLLLAEQGSLLEPAHLLEVEQQVLERPEHRRIIGRLNSQPECAHASEQADRLLTMPQVKLGHSLTMQGGERPWVFGTPQAGTGVVCLLGQGERLGRPASRAEDKCEMLERIDRIRMIRAQDTPPRVHDLLAE